MGHVDVVRLLLDGGQLGQGHGHFCRLLPALAGQVLGQGDVHDQACGGDDLGQIHRADVPLGQRRQILAGAGDHDAFGTDLPGGVRLGGAAAVLDGDGQGNLLDLAHHQRHVHLAAGQAELFAVDGLAVLIHQGHRQGALPGLGQAALLQRHHRVVDAFDEALVTADGDVIVFQLEPVLHAPLRHRTGKRAGDGDDLAADADDVHIDGLHALGTDLHRAVGDGVGEGDGVVQVLLAGDGDLRGRVHGDGHVVLVQLGQDTALTAELQGQGDLLAVGDHQATAAQGVQPLEGHGDVPDGNLGVRLHGDVHVEPTGDGEDDGDGDIKPFAVFDLIPHGQNPLFSPGRS